MADQTQAGLVDWGDANFVPESSSRTGDFIRFFRMSLKWPDKPFDDRKFQLGGKERIAILEPVPYVCWAHRFSVQYMGSGVNGTRRCSLDTRGSCLACSHWDAAPEIMKDNRKQKDARCGRRQQQFGVNIMVYKTDLDGRLLDEQNREILLSDNGPVLQTGEPANLVYEVYLWRFNAEKFQDMRDIKTEWGDLTKMDYVMSLATGKPEQFQDFSATPSPKAAWRELAKHGTTAGAEAFVQYYKDNKYNVEAILGKLYDDAEMAQFLGLTSGQPTPNSQPIADVAKSIEDEIASLGVATPPTGDAQPAPSEQPAQAPPAAPPETPAPQSLPSNLDELLKS